MTSCGNGVGNKVVEQKNKVIPQNCIYVQWDIYLLPTWERLPLGSDNTYFVFWKCFAFFFTVLFKESQTLAVTSVRNTMDPSLPSESFSWSTWFTEVNSTQDFTIPPDSTKTLFIFLLSLFTARECSGLGKETLAPQWRTMLTYSILILIPFTPGPSGRLSIS